MNVLCFDRNRKFLRALIKVKFTLVYLVIFERKRKDKIYNPESIIYTYALITKQL